VRSEELRRTGEEWRICPWLIDDASCEGEEKRKRTIRVSEIEDDPGLLQDQANVPVRLAAWGLSVLRLGRKTEAITGDDQLGALSLINGREGSADLLHGKSTGDDRRGEMRGSWSWATRPVLEPPIAGKPIDGLGIITRGLFRLL
jgi:hypothetical protein